MRRSGDEVLPERSCHQQESRGESGDLRANAWRKTQHATILGAGIEGSLSPPLNDAWEIVLVMQENKGTTLTGHRGSNAATNTHPTYGGRTASAPFAAVSRMAFVVVTIVSPVFSPNVSAMRGSFPLHMES